MTDHMPPRWAVPAPPPYASRVLRARHAAAEARARNEMRWIWNELCSGLDLTRRIVPTGTVTREPPRMGRITLGPPTRFTVELRPGQLRRDIARWSERVAAAFEVPEVQVDDLVRGWVVVELVEGFLLLDEPLPPSRALPDPPAAAPTSPSRPGSARGRRPFGRPRSWGPRRAPRAES